jgi:hypothetical protein
VPVVFSVLAVVLGLKGLSDIRESKGRLRGSKLAVAGIVSGTLSLVVAIALGLFVGVNEVRSSAANAESLSNLKAIAVAFHAYDEKHKRLPPAVVFSPDKRPLYSWRVLLLPHLGHGDLYAQFRLDEPWDSPHNIQFVRRMPSVYAHPHGDDNGAGLTHYQVFTFAGKDDGTGRPIFRSDPFGLQALPVGQPGRLMGSSHYRVLQIPDGASSTILVAEAAEPVPWTKPEDLVYLPNGPLPRFAGLIGGRCNVVLADGITRNIDPRTISEETLRAAITADGSPWSNDW